LSVYLIAVITLSMWECYIYSLHCRDCG